MQPKPLPGHTDDACVAWAQEDFLIHLAPEDMTLCGLPVGGEWVSRSDGVFYKRKTLKGRDMLCPTCLKESGGRGPIRRNRAW